MFWSFFINELYLEKTIMDFENDFIMPRPKTHFYQEYTTSECHKAVVHMYLSERKKVPCWFIRGKVTVPPIQQKVEYIASTIKSESDKFFKRECPTKRYIVEVEYVKDLKKAKDYYKYKETKISYLICFLKSGSLEDVFNFTKPLIDDLDKGILHWM